MFNDDNNFYFGDEDKEKIDEIIPSIKAEMLLNNYDTFENYYNDNYNIDEYNDYINIYDFLIEEGVYSLEELWDYEEERFTDNVFDYAEVVYQYVSDRLDEEDFDYDDVVSEIDNDIIGKDKKITNFLSNIDSLSVKIAKWIYNNSDDRKGFLKALIESDREEEEEEE